MLCAGYIPIAFTENINIAMCMIRPSSITNHYSFLFELRLIKILSMLTAYLFAWETTAPQSDSDHSNNSARSAPASRTNLTTVTTQPGQYQQQYSQHTSMSIHLNTTHIHTHMRFTLIVFYFFINTQHTSDTGHQHYTDTELRYILSRLSLSSILVYNQSSTNSTVPHRPTTTPTMILKN